MTINIRQLEIQAGTEEGARILFEKLIVHLMKVQYRDAKRIRSARGDWGIDAIRGELSSGTCIIWQAKYFINGIDKSQKEQIRDSFKQVVKKSKEKRFKIKAWSLCVPCSLSPEETKWWESWHKKKTKETNIIIGLIDETEIETMLMTSDAEHVRLGFFGDVPSMLDYYLQSIKGMEERDIQQLPDEKLYEKSMFIKKLIVAGIQETIAARTQFFNAELLKSEIHDKGDDDELNELVSLYEKIRSMWESRFNEALNSENPEREVPNVYSKVLQAIEDTDKEILISPKLMASFLHKQGFMQQLADHCEIGWTQDFRTLDDEHN